MDELIEFIADYMVKHQGEWENEKSSEGDDGSNACGDRRNRNLSGNDTAGADSLH